MPPHALSSALKAKFVGLGPFFLSVLIAKPAEAILRDGRLSVSQRLLYVRSVTVMVANVSMLAS